MRQRWRDGNATAKRGRGDLKRREGKEPTGANSWGLWRVNWVGRILIMPIQKTIGKKGGKFVRVARTATEICR